MERETVVDEGEVAALAAAWGEPHRHHVELQVGPTFWYPWEGKWHTRRGEVLFVLPRPGGLLLHRKPHYPQDCFRLLTGGIERGESVAAAIAREPEEEVGLSLPVRRYVALLSYDVRLGQEHFPWVTHIFLLPFSDAPLRPSHDGEIEEIRVLPLNALAAVADLLDRLPEPWQDWGRFRAFAHRLVLSHVRPEELGNL